MHVFQRLESEARSYCRRFPAIFEKARGSLMFDVDGRTYIDFLSSAGVVNYGHNNRVLKNAIIDYLENEGPITSLDFHTQAKRTFLETFEANILVPRGLRYRMQFTSPTGTSVIESAVKLARKVTGRSNVVAFTNGFHGMSGTALSLTGNRYHRQSYIAGHVTRLPFDKYLGESLDTVAYFRKLLRDNSSGVDLPAAVVLETVQAEGGINIASSEWLQSLRALTREYGILMIVDDIQVGCGRTGRFFSFEDAGIVPDMVCLSKSLSGMGLPFSLLLLHPDIDVWNPGEDNGTFRGNNLAFVSGAAALCEYWADGRLQDQVARLEVVIKRWLADLRRVHPGDIVATRGRGLIHGIEFRNPEQAGAIARRCFELGLIIETCGSDDQVLKLLPALTIPEQVLRDGLAVLGEAVDAGTAAKAVIDEARRVKV